MNPWFSPEVAPQFAWLSLLSFMALMSFWIRQGRHRSIVFGSYYASIGLGLALLLAGGLAWLLGQPEYVTSSLALAGFVITVVFVATIGIVRKGYAEADQRRMLAKDI